MNATNPQTLFDHQRLRQNRMRATHHFSSHSVLFDETSMQMFDRIQGINRPFQRILDMGSRTFSLSKSLFKQDASRFIVHCPSSPDVNRLRANHVCVAQEDWLPYRDCAFDLVLSNLNLHWTNDLPGALIQMRRALKPDGFFLGSLFGGETLHELRDSLYEAEMNLRGGVSQHISPFADIQDCGRLLQRAGLSLPVIDKERFTLVYSDIYQLMRELRGMGEGNILNTRDKRFMPRALFEEAGRLYQNRYATESGKIRATFDILFIAGWAPHDNQQKPLKPGEAKERLANALNTREIETGDRIS